MKHVRFFHDFLRNHVNLNQSRLDTLDQKVKTIVDLLESKLPNYSKYSQQGSYAHGTVIKPVRKNDEFDADILIFLEDEDFNPGYFDENYVCSIHSVFKENGNYKEIVRRKTRCVTIDYSGDFHLDVVPCISHGKDHYICNSKEEKYEETDGDGYKDWLADKNNIVGGNNLQKAIRIFKYLRDHKKNFSITSILLTTILGNQITTNDENSDEFKDLSTTLKTLSNRVNDFLQTNPMMPTICNPVLPDEDFNRKWNDAKYKNFREKFNIYNQKINGAFNEEDYDSSINKWRNLFGDTFGQQKTSDNLARISVMGAVAGFSPRVEATKPYSY